MSGRDNSFFTPQFAENINTMGIAKKEPKLRPNESHKEQEYYKPGLVGQIKQPMDDKSRELYNLIYNSMTDEERRENDKKNLKRAIKQERKRIYEQSKKMQKQNNNIVYSNADIESINQEFRDYERSQKNMDKKKVIQKPIIEEKFIDVSMDDSDTHSFRQINYNYSRAENILSGILKTEANKNTKKPKMHVSFENDGEKENKNYMNLLNDRNGNSNSFLNTNINSNSNDSSNANTNQNQESDLSLKKKGRGRNNIDYSSEINDYFNNVVKNNLENPNHKIIPTTINRLNLLQKKRNPPKFKDIVKEIKEKRKIKNKDPNNKSNENEKTNEKNLLQMIFKEYGYQNMIYAIAGDCDNKLGKNKEKKIRTGLNDLLDYDKHQSKIIKSIIDMKKYDLFDESCYKGSKNNHKVKRSSLVESYHYQKGKDGYIYKFEMEYDFKNGQMMYKCCDRGCEGKGILNINRMTFKMKENHSLTGLEHNYIMKGYDKFQTKMDLRNWSDIQLKNNIEEKKYFIEWHKSNFHLLNNNK